MDLIPTDFTDDEYERALLIHDESPPDPNDPYHVEMHDIAVLLANFRSQLTSFQKRAIPHLHQGKRYTDIAKTLGCSPQTITNAMNNPNVRQCLRLLEQADRLQHGPTLAQRKAMAWRIAARAEVDKPTISLRALDLMNKQDGVYKPEETGNQGVVVNIQEFRIENHHHRTEAPLDVTTSPKDITPEAFKPATISQQADDA